MRVISDPKTSKSSKQIFDKFFIIFSLTAPTVQKLFIIINIINC